MRLNLPEVLQTFLHGDSNVFIIIKDAEPKRRYVTFRKTKATINGEDVVIVTIRDVGDSINV
jgi:hypothetical protein